MAEESTLEKCLRIYALSHGVRRYLKLNIVGERGYPDRLLLGDDGKIAFMELKAAGEEPSPQQARRIGDLLDLGQIATYINSYDAGVAFIDRVFATPG